MPAWPRAPRGEIVGGLLGGSAGRLGEVHTLPAHDRRSEDDDEDHRSQARRRLPRPGQPRPGRGRTPRTWNDIVIVQDADLEYNPSDYPKLIQPILDDHADVVFGSRFIGGAARRVLYFWHAVGNRVLTALSNLCTNIDLTDMGTGYKVFRLRGRNPTLSGCQPTARVSGS